VCREHDLALKAIALVRPSEDPGFYGGGWVDPRALEASLAARGAQHLATRRRFGGVSRVYRVPAPSGSIQVEVKNVADGRLRTTFCAGCPHDDACGEGIYGLRVGVDGLWKPCLLRRERFWRVDDRPYRDQILDAVSAMVGVWEAARWRVGAPT
jgi:hypothetical protein